MNKVSELSGIFSLSFLSDVQLASFDCGKLSLNAWLAQKARGNEISGGSRTYVLLTTEAEIAGFYTLSNYCIAHEGMGAVIKRNMPNPIPAVLLGRLAVSRQYQGKGIGRILLRHAIEKSCKVAEITGAVLLITEPIDAAAMCFYTRCGFESIGAQLPFLAVNLHKIKRNSSNG